MRGIINVSCARFIMFLIICLTFFFNFAYAAEDALKNESFVGVVSGDRVNIRANDTTSSEVLCQLNKGEEVNVVGRKGKWYKVELPKNVLVYVHKTNVSGKNGLWVISEDKTNVRAAATQSSSVVGKLSKGANVKVIKEYLDWCEIEAPKGAFGWVYSDYVKKDRNFEFKRSAPLSEKLAQLNEAYIAELKKPLREIELKWLPEEYRKFAIENKGSAEAQEAALKAEEVGLKIAELEHLKAKEEYDAKLKNITSPRPGEEPLAAGVLSNVGKVTGRLSRFKLTKDGKFIGYLTSSKVDLNKYVNIPIKIWGVKKEVKGVALYEIDAVSAIQ